MTDYELTTCRHAAAMTPLAADGKFGASLPDPVATCRKLADALGRAAEAALAAREELRRVREAEAERWREAEERRRGKKRPTPEPRGEPGRLYEACPYCARFVGEPCRACRGLRFLEVSPSGGTA